MKAKTPPVVPAALRILPKIREIIAGARKHVAIAANLTMVNLYWNIGQIITRDIQQNAKRAGYGDQLLNGLAQALTKEYGQDYSVSNLNDMRCFYDFFRILQTASVESLTTASRKTTSGRFSKTQTLQTLSVECSDRLPIDFQKHFTLGWSHYRLLLGQHEPEKRKFYFEQAASQRWSVRELQRKIEGALFERVALSRDKRDSISTGKNSCSALDVSGNGQKAPSCTLTAWKRNGNLTLVTTPASFGERARSRSERDGSCFFVRCP